MNSSRTESERALTDVRRAYRLLHDYQQAALDTVRHVGTRLGFTHCDGCSNFSDATPRGNKQNLFTCWAWDWLNLYFYDFTFVQKDANGKEMYLAIWLFSDTGYFQSDAKTPQPRDITTFAPAESSKTMVAFFFFRTWPEALHGFNDDRDAVRVFLETGDKLPPAFKNNGAYGKCFDFSDLADDKSAEKVIAELVNFAISKDYPLAPVTTAD